MKDNYYLLGNICDWPKIRKIADNVEYKMPPTIDDPAILEEIKQDLIDNKILNNG